MIFFIQLSISLLSTGGTLDNIENKIKNLDKMEKDNSRNAISKIEENSDRYSFQFV